MKKLLFSLLLISSLSNAQALFDKGVKITGGITTDNTATKVVVQSANNVLNTISKTELQDAFYFATASALPVVGITDKLYITRDDNKLYRFNGTIYIPLNAGITSTATTNFIPKVNAGGNLVNSTISEDANGVLIQGNYVGANIAPLVVKNNTPYGSPFTQMVALFQNSIGNNLIALRADGVTTFQSFASMASLSIRDLGTAATASIRLGNVNGTGLFSPSANAIAFTAGGTEAGRIHTSRRWSINSTTDDGINQLQVNGTVKASPAVTSDQLATLGQVNSSAILLTGAQTATGRKTLVNTDAVFGGLTITNNRTTNDQDGTAILIQGSGRVGIELNGNNEQSIRVINTRASGIGVLSNQSGSNAKNFFTQLSNNNGIGYYAIQDAGGNSIPFQYINQDLGRTTQVNVDGTISGQPATTNTQLITKAQTLYNNQTITANKTVTTADFINNNELILSVDTTSGNITVTLPTFNDLRGYKITVKKMDSSANSVTVTGTGGINIDGSANLIISGQYSKETLGANLSQYIIL